MITEINFDGIVGPSHNFAGLSLGNLAATRNAGAVSHPREAALQGVAKMRVALALGLRQGILLPHRRPNEAWLASLGTNAAAADNGLRANALSAAAMWAANAATISPATDCADFPPIPRQDYSNILIQRKGMHAKSFECVGFRARSGGGSASMNASSTARATENAPL